MKKQKNYYFGDKLQSLRKEHNLSQEAFAEILDVSRQSVSKWESGKIYPEIDKLIFISNYFHISLDELIKESPQSEETDEDIMPQRQEERKVINLSKPDSLRYSEEDIMPSGYEMPSVQPDINSPLINNVQYVDGIPKKKINRKKRWLRIIAVSSMAAASISFIVVAIVNHNKNIYYDDVAYTEVAEDVIYNEVEVIPDFEENIPNFEDEVIFNDDIELELYENIGAYIDDNGYESYKYSRYNIFEKVYYYYDATMEKYVEVLVPLAPCEEGNGIYGWEFSTLYLKNQGVYINVIYLKDNAPGEPEYVNYYSDKFGRYMKVLLPPNCSSLESRGYKVICVYDSNGDPHKMIVKDE